MVNDDGNNPRGAVAHMKINERLQNSLLAWRSSYND
jgi:hypothetical protein